MTITLNHFSAAAVFALFAMMARLRNGHIAIVRTFDAASQTESWTLTDEKRWLW